MSFHFLLQTENTYGVVCHTLICIASAQSQDYLSIHPGLSVHQMFQNFCTQKRLYVTRVPVPSVI